MHLLVYTITIMRSVLFMNTMRAGIAFTRSSINKHIGYKVATVSKFQHFVNPKQVSVITSACLGNPLRGNHRFMSTTANFFRMSMARNGYALSSASTSTPSRTFLGGNHRGSLRLMSTSQGQDNPMDPEQYVRDLRISDALHHIFALNLSVRYVVSYLCPALLHDIIIDRKGLGGDNKAFTNGRYVPGPVLGGSSLVEDTPRRRRKWTYPKDCFQVRHRPEDSDVVVGWTP